MSSANIAVLYLLILSVEWVIEANHLHNGETLRDCLLDSQAKCQCNSTYRMGGEPGRIFTRQNLISPSSCMRIRTKSLSPMKPP